MTRPPTKERRLDGQFEPAQGEGRRTVMQPAKRQRRQPHSGFSREGFGYG